MKKRITRCRNLLKWLKTANSDTIVITDEKFWSVNEKYNSVNSRVYSNDRTGIPYRFRNV